MAQKVSLSAPYCELCGALWVGRLLRGQRKATLLFILIVIIWGEDQRARARLLRACPGQSEHWSPLDAVVSRPVFTGAATAVDDIIVLDHDRACSMVAFFFELSVPSLSWSK